MQMVSSQQVSKPFKSSCIECFRSDIRDHVEGVQVDGNAFLVFNFVPDRQRSHAHRTSFLGQNTSVHRDLNCCRVVLVDDGWLLLMKSDLAHQLPQTFDIA